MLTKKKKRRIDRMVKRLMCSEMKEITLNGKKAMVLDDWSCLAQKVKGYIHNEITRKD